MPKSQMTCVIKQKHNLQGGRGRRRKSFKGAGSETEGKRGDSDSGIVFVTDNTLPHVNKT